MPDAPTPTPTPPPDAAVDRPAFLELPDLACEAVGGAAILCNDEFFAEKENLLREHAAVWKDHAYTDRGKWMDGWESRRRREPGHDWCIVRLGLPGYADAIESAGSPPVSKLSSQFAEAGGRLFVCPICFNARKLDEQSLVGNAVLAGATPLCEWIGDDATVFSY